LSVGVVATLIMGCLDFLRDHSARPAALGGIFLVGALGWCVSEPTVLFTEVWAGMLIALSVCALRRGWTTLGMAAGLLALFYRELSLPYVCVCLGLAVWQGRRREAAAWGVGLALFGVFMGFHAHEVLSRLTSLDVGMDRGWVRFGGVRFLLATAQTNVFLMPLPLWCTAIYLPLTVIGLTGWKGESARRVGLTAVLYISAFAVAGAPFNFYWGFLYSPLLAMGIAHAPSALRSTLDAALRQDPLVSTLEPTPERRAPGEALVPTRV
jgi:hypothetical protein